MTLTWNYSQIADVYTSTNGVWVIYPVPELPGLYYLEKQGIPKRDILTTGCAESRKKLAEKLTEINGR